MKIFNNNTDDDDDDGDDDTYYDKIRSKLSDIRMILSRLGNTTTNNDRKKIKRKLYEVEKKENLSDKKKEKIYDDLVKLAETINGKKNINIMTMMI